MQLVLDQVWPARGTLLSERWQEVLIALWHFPVASPLPLPPSPLFFFRLFFLLPVIIDSTLGIATMNEAKQILMRRRLVKTVGQSILAMSSGWAVSVSLHTLSRGKSWAQCCQ